MRIVRCSCMKIESFDTHQAFACISRRFEQCVNGLLIGFRCFCKLLFLVAAKNISQPSAYLAERRRSEVKLIFEFKCRWCDFLDGFFQSIVSAPDEFSLPEADLVRSRSMAKCTVIRLSKMRGPVFSPFIFCRNYNALRKTQGSEKKMLIGKKKVARETGEKKSQANGRSTRVPVGAVRRTKMPQPTHRHPAARLPHHVPPASSTGVRTA